MRKFKFDKKYIPAFLLTTACIVVGILCLIKAVDDIKYNEKISESDVFDLAQITVIADGGNGTEIPANTKFAVDDLVKKGFTSIKIDARLTKDKKWVSLAESDISSVTDGKGDVSDFNYYDLLNYNIKNYLSQEFPVIELASDTAKHAHENGLTAIIYLHNYNKSAIKSLLNTLSSDGTYVPFIASSNIKTLEYVNKLDKNINLIYYVDEITEENISLCKENPSFSLCFNAQNKNNFEKVEQMILDEINFLCFGAETLKDIEDLYKIGVRSFITNTVKAG